jgi:hypothetical protein
MWRGFSPISDIDETEKATFNGHSRPFPRRFTMHHLQADLGRLFERKYRKKADRDRAMLPLQPLYAAVTGGTYRLLPAFAVDPKDAGVAIAVATGLRGATVELATFATAAKAVDDGLDTSRLGDLLRDRQWAALAPLLGDSLAAELDTHVEAFDSLLEEALWDDVGERLPSAFDGKRFIDVRYGMRMAVRSYLGRSLAADDGAARRIVPLLRLLAGAIPLGETATPPHRWMVLTA